MRTSMLLHRWLGRAMFIPVVYFTAFGRPLYTMPFFVLGYLWIRESQHEAKELSR